MAPPAPATAPLDHLALLAGLQSAFAAAIAEVDPEARVPWCGRWRVRHVVVHLARIHHWAAAEARGGREVPLGRGPFDLQVLYRTCADELCRLLLDLGPDADVSTLLGRGPASFWRRRQAHETLVHLWDVRAAVGARIDVPEEVWADTVDEVVTVMHPRQVRLGRTPPLAHPIDVVATGPAERRWRLGGEPTDAGADAVVQVHGPASALALLLWGRTTPDDDALTVSGDRAVLDAALAQPLTP